MLTRRKNTCTGITAKWKAHLELCLVQFVGQFGFHFLQFTFKLVFFLLQPCLFLLKLCFQFLKIYK